MSALMLRDVPVAMQCNYVTGDGCFAFKSAFDETYSHFSPGTLLLLDTVTGLSRRPGLHWVDSCTAPQNNQVNRLSSGRRRIVTITTSAGKVSPQKTVASTLIRALPSLRLAKRLLLDHITSAPEVSKV